MRREHFACVAVMLTAGVSLAQFERATPESQGIPSQAIRDWVEAADRAGGYQGFVLLRHGKTVAEGWWKPGDAETPHLLYSLSKSFTSTAIGMLLDDRKLDLDERVADIFPDKLPPSPSANLLAMRVRDLLCMNTGHDTDSSPHLDAASDGDWVRGFLAHPVPLKPGSRFLYDSGATYLLASIIRQRTGQNVSEFLRERFFGPLGIRNVRWNRSPQGTDCGGWGLVLTTRDIARFGQFWLQGGVWNGKRLLSRHYVALATSKETENSDVGHFEGEDVSADWHQGYGFQFWICRHGCYRAAGAYGQLVVVMPEKDAVLAVNSNSSMRRSLADTWKFLLANMRDDPLPENPDAARALEARTAALALPVVEGRQDDVCNAVGRTFRSEDGSSFVLKADESGWRLAFDFGKWKGEIPIGYRQWRKGETEFPEQIEHLHRIIGRQPTAACGAWTEKNVFKAQIRFVETPHAGDMRISFGRDGAELSLESAAKNVVRKIEKMR